MRNPFWKESRKTWYCWISGRQVNLGKDKDEAFKEYYRQMAGEQPADSKTTVEVLLDQFLVWTKKNRAEGTYDWYLKHLQSFADYVGPRLTVFKVRAFHVSRWLDKRYVTVGDNYRNGAARAVNRAFNWARKQGLIETNPIVGLERPTFQPREDWLTPEQWEKTIASVPPDDALHDFLWFLHETGCRPVEARTVEARHWDRAHDRFVLERRMSKGHSRQSVIEKRVIRLNERAVEIVRKWALKYPEGPLFRNNRGRPWKRSP